MSDMEETEGTEGAGGPAAPRRGIGTPPPSPRLLGSTAVAEDGDAGKSAGEAGEASDIAHGGEHFKGQLPLGPRDIEHAQRAQAVVAACFTLAFFTGCAF